MDKKRKITGMMAAIAVIISLLVVNVPAEEKDKTIKFALSPMEGEDVYPIPVGSIIVHLPDGTTEVYSPQKKLILSVEDKDVEMIPTPSGFVRATHVHQVPTGALIDTRGNTTEVYKDGRCILTVITIDLNKVQSRTSSDGIGGWI